MTNTILATNNYIYIYIYIYIYMALLPYVCMYVCMPKWYNPVVGH